MLVAKTSVDQQLPRYPYGMPCDRVLSSPGPVFAPGTSQGFSPADLNTQAANQSISQALGLGCADCKGTCGLGGDAPPPSDNVFTWLGGTIGVVVALFAYDYLKKYWRAE